MKFAVKRVAKISTKKPIFVRTESGVFSVGTP
jgi:hypothetical protein